MTQLMKGNNVYDVYSNSIGIKPDDLVQYRVYRDDVVISTVNLTAITLGSIKRSQGEYYKLLLSDTNDYCMIDNRAHIPGLLEKPEGLRFELEVVQ